MRCTRNVLGLVMSATFAIVAGSLANGALSRTPLHDMTCFTIGAVVECIDSGFIMPPMIGAGAADEGTNETFIIEDNGGYDEVRG